MTQQLLGPRRLHSRSIYQGEGRRHSQVTGPVKPTKALSSSSSVFLRSAILLSCRSINASKLDSLACSFFARSIETFSKLELLIQGSRCGSFGFANSIVFVIIMLEQRQTMYSRHWLMIKPHTQTSCFPSSRYLYRRRKF